MLTLDQVKEVLSFNTPWCRSWRAPGNCAPCGSVGGRGVWRVRGDDLLACCEAPHGKTAQPCGGQIPAETTIDD